MSERPKFFHVIAETELDAKKIEIPVDRLEKQGFTLRQRSWRGLEGWRHQPGDHVLFGLMSPLSRVNAIDILARGTLQQKMFARLIGADYYEIHSFEQLKDGE